MPIPYPKREFLTGDDNDDKADTGASKVGDKVSLFLHPSKLQNGTTFSFSLLYFVSYLIK